MKFEVLVEIVEEHLRPNTFKVLVLLVFCFSFATGEAGPVSRQFGAWGFDLNARDLTAKPGDNFYRYANGSYLNRLTIPADRSGYSTATILTEPCAHLVSRANIVATRRSGVALRSLCAAVILDSQRCSDRRDNLLIAPKDAREHNQSACGRPRDSPFPLQRDCAKMHSLPNSTLER
jgi:hypothetical protein